MTYPKSVLFVCLGNICRSPTAEAVMRQKSCQAGLEIVFDSAGTAGYHIGSLPDKRALAVGSKLGYELSSLRARQLTTEDFYLFEMIFAMDMQNLADIQTLKQKYAPSSQAQIALFDSKRSVKDPYYGDELDFENMVDHIACVADGWIASWRDGV